MMNIVGDWAPPRGATPDAKCLAVQASKLIAAGEYTFDGVTFPLELCVSADHKGVSSRSVVAAIAHRGASARTTRSTPSPLVET